MSLKSHGLSEELARRMVPQVPQGLELARVVVVHRANLALELERGPVMAELTGRLRYGAASDSELPAVGDWVLAQVLDEGDFAVVVEVLPRATELKRRLPGKGTDHQMMAANLDTAFIVHPVDRPVHERRIERYLVMARDGGIEPVIVLSKADLITSEECEAALAVASRLAASVAVSSVETGGMDSLAARMVPGETHVLLGPSGVGKSTMLNALLGREVMATRAVRAVDGKGRHTTTRRELVVLDSGAIVIDTPGMRELGLTDMQTGLDDSFAEIAALAESCRYRDCSHTDEGGCALLAAVAASKLDDARLQSFLRLQREADHYERSEVEQRRRDKAFGKMVKSAMSKKRQRR